MHYEWLKHTGEYPIVGVDTFSSEKTVPNGFTEKVIRSTEEKRNNLQIQNLENFQKSLKIKLKDGWKNLQLAAINQKIYSE